VPNDERSPVRERSAPIVISFLVEHPAKISSSKSRLKIIIFSYVILSTF